MRRGGSNAVTFPVGCDVRAHVERERTALAGLELGRHHPGADAVGGGDGVPHLLGCARDGELELEAVGDVGCGHGRSSVFVGGGGSSAVASAGTGATRRRGDAAARRRGGSGRRGRARRRPARRRTRPGPRRSGTHLGIERERRQPPARGVGQARQRADLVDDAAGERDEVVGRQLVGDLLGAGAVAGDRGGRDDVGGRRGAQHALEIPPRIRISASSTSPWDSRVRRW